MENCTHHDHGHSAPSVASAATAPTAETRPLTFALIAVTVFLGIQTVQLVSLRRSLASAPVLSAAPAASAAASNAAPLPSSLQNLPNMVGGC